MDIHQFIEKLIAEIKLKPGTVTHINMQHDTGCPAIKTHCIADCVCRPEIKKMQAQ